MFQNDDENTYPENKSPVLPTGEIVLVRRKIFATMSSTRTILGSILELVSKELNHLAAILHVYAGGLNFTK